jgi:heme/copper-type cytochrome/quinol oxidase subunit 2
LTEEEKKSQEVSQKHRRYYLWEALFIALIVVIVIGTPLIIYWWNSSVVAGYDSDRVINIIARNDVFDKVGRWLVQEGNGWNYGDITAPSEVKVKQGEKVTLRITSFDVLHGFRSEDYGIESKQIYPGKLTEITFVANKAGRFPFKCTIACGVGHNDMFGELIVEPSS